jgi:hypothetical protein
MADLFKVYKDNRFNGNGDALLLKNVVELMSRCLSISINGDGTQHAFTS